MRLRRKPKFNKKFMRKLMLDLHKLNLSVIQTDDGIKVISHEARTPLCKLNIGYELPSYEIKNYVIEVIAPRAEKNVYIFTSYDEALRTIRKIAECMWHAQHDPWRAKPTYDVPIRTKLAFDKLHEIVQMLKKEFGIRSKDIKLIPPRVEFTLDKSTLSIEVIELLKRYLVYRLREAEYILAESFENFNKIKQYLRRRMKRRLFSSP